MIYILNLYVLHDVVYDTVRFTLEYSEMGYIIVP